MFEPNSTGSWLVYADESYIATRLLHFTGLFIESSVNAHRTVELILKAYLVSQSHGIKRGDVWGHELGPLLKKCAAHDSGFDMQPLGRRVAYFQNYFDLVRYPTCLDDKLSDGRLIWFGEGSLFVPLDEVMAFVRPRIVMLDSDWLKSHLSQVRNSNNPMTEYQKKALIEQNQHIDEIICSTTTSTQVAFDPGFTLDLPGC